LNLICEEPFSIALIGTMSFISFAIGGILYIDSTDQKGRKKVLVLLSLVVPLLLVLMLFFAKSLMSIYIFVFIMGLTYCTRNSTAYLYCSEFVEHRYRLQLGQYHFMSLGI